MAGVGAWAYRPGHGQPQPDPPLRESFGRQEVVLLAPARWRGEAGAVPRAGGLR